MKHNPINRSDRLHRAKKQPVTKSKAAGGCGFRREGSLSRSAAEGGGAAAKLQCFPGKG